MTGSGFFATVIVPIEVSPLLRDQTVEHREVPESLFIRRCNHIQVWNRGAEPSLDFLAPLLDSAELPQEAVELRIGVQ